MAISTYLFGAALIAVVSWLDDLRPLPNRIRFAAHSTDAMLAILGFGYWHSVDIPLVGQLCFGWLGFLVTFLWLVGLTNAYNFMDGIDGHRWRTSDRCRIGLGYFRMAGLMEDTFRLVGRESPIGRATIDKYTENIAVGSQRIQAELGFKPQYDLRSGWRETVQEMRKMGEL